jgi:protein-disulfide isomerase
MKKTFGFLCALLLVTPSFAIDKNRLARHMRAMLGIDTRSEIVVGDPTPSTFAGLLTVPVTIGGGNYVIYLTQDEKQYFWGNVNDLAIDPDKSKMEKISMANVHSKGSKSAPVTIVEYTDLQCPYCSRAHEGLSKDLYAKYTKDQVRVVFKHYPLGMHPWAEPAAVAAECAGQQSEDAFWKMADMYFMNQSSFTTANVSSKAVEKAQALKLNMTKYNQCLSSVDALNKVRADREEGNQLGVSSTPTLFVNGRMRRGFGRFEDLQVVIDEKLAEAKKK